MFGYPRGYAYPRLNTTDPESAVTESRARKPKNWNSIPRKPKSSISHPVQIGARPHPASYQTGRDANHSPPSGVEG